MTGGAAGHEELPARTAELAAQPGYGRLLAAIRGRLEEGGQPATLTLRGLDADARRALADLLERRRVPGLTARVRLADLDAALRASRVGAGLVDVLEALDGPLADRRAARDAEQEAWEAVWAVDHPAAERPEVAAWLDGLRRTGVLRRLARDPGEAAGLLADALAVVDCLPARGVARGVLATEAVGDPHALDHGQPLATLVLRAVAAMVGAEVPSSARGRRQLWADVGVASDPLSTSVLVCGLWLDGTDIVADACNTHAGFGFPLRLTLAQLEAVADDNDGLRSRDPQVLVCENPAVVAAAAERLDHQRPACPLVCTDGMPDVACDRLLSALAAGGTQVAVHADFDWGGLRVANALTGRYGAVPWRFTAADYRAALERAAATKPLAGSGVAASWDAELAPAMRHAGVAIAEEALLDVLLADVTPG